MATYWNLSYKFGDLKEKKSLKFDKFGTLFLWKKSFVCLKIIFFRLKFDKIHRMGYLDQMDI